MQKLRIIEIGFGPHAKRIYAPALQKWGSKFNSELSLVIDLKREEQTIRDYFKGTSLYPEFLFIDPFEGSLPSEVEKYLNEFVDKNGVQAVIISTEPTVHMAYANWALNKGLNILMDKPVTTRSGVVTDIKTAKQIEDDYKLLLNKYNKLQQKKETVFVINAQRRFHPGFKLVNELLAEVAQKTNCPITSIQSMHCDGQWRLPNEIVTQTYHPYNSGYGKASHSGYHIFDTVYQFYKNSKLTGKIADSMEIFSSFLQPRGFLYQLNQQDYLNFFGKDYLKVRVRKYNDEMLYKIFKDYGEIDLSALIRLRREKDCIGNISINLLHNGFARRTWMLPGADLYKGSGRVKHEYHNIQQGPFQNIQIHSYQSKDKHDSNTDEDYKLGGNNHFDIYVFRNCGMTGNKKPMRIITMKDIKNQGPIIGDDKLVIEQIKHRVVADFLGFLQALVRKDQVLSNIDDHLMPAQIMSGVYQSHIRYSQGKNPLVKYKLNR